MSLFLSEVVQGLALSGVYGLMAIGITFIYAVTGIVELAQGVVMIAGAYGGFVVARWLIPNLLLALIGGIAVAAVLGALIYDGVVRWVRKVGHLGLVATLLIGTVIEETVRLLFYNGHPVVYPSALGNILGGGESYQFLVLGISIGLAVVFEWFLAKSRYGLALRATADNEEAARLLGVPTSAMMRGAMVVGSALAGGSGVLFATLLQFLSPSVGNNVLFFGLAAVLFGGLGSIRGAIVAAFVIGLSQVLAETYIASAYGETVAFGIIILVMLVRPKGIFVYSRGART